MLEPPDLPNDLLLARLREAFAITAGEITFLPIGNDASGWVVRVDAASEPPYFLKVKRGAVYVPGLEIPYWLRSQGIAQVVAPLPATDGRLFAALEAAPEAYTLILYPFIEGVDGMSAGLAESQWVDFGRLLKNIHASVPPPGMAPVEEFHPPWARMVREIDQHIARQGFTDPLEQAMAVEWQANRSVFLAILERTEALGSLLRANPPERVLCHSDIHTANLLVDSSGGLHIIDWDDPRLAPRERDLMFIPGGVQGEWFYQGYSPAHLSGYAHEASPLAAAYYHCEWVVQEVGDYGERVFRMPDLGAATREQSVREFQQLFAPGNVVDAAHQSLRALPGNLFV